MIITTLLPDLVNFIIIFLINDVHQSWMFLCAGVLPDIFIYHSFKDLCDCISLLLQGSVVLCSISFFVGPFFGNMRMQIISSCEVAGIHAYRIVKPVHFMMSWWAKTFFQILVLLPVVILWWLFLKISLPFIVSHLGLILFGTNHLLSVLILVRIDFGDHCLLQSPALLCARFERQFHVLFTIYFVPMVCDAKLYCIQLATLH